MKTRVYVVKTTCSRMPTVIIYGKDDGLNHVANRVREYLNYPGVNLEWIGTAVVTGGTNDHPLIGRVEKNSTLTKLFENMVYNPEAIVR